VSNSSAAPSPRGPRSIAGPASAVSAAVRSAAATGVRSGVLNPQRARRHASARAAEVDDGARASYAAI